MAPRSIKDCDAPSSFALWKLPSLLCRAPELCPGPAADWCSAPGGAGGAVDAADGACPRGGPGLSAAATASANGSERSAGVRRPWCAPALPAPASLASRWYPSCLPCGRASTLRAIVCLLLPWDDLNPCTYAPSQVRVVQLQVLMARVDGSGGRGWRMG
jgi:hypothetical protein